MSATTITLSSKGQVVIPKEVRDALHWDAGTTLTLVASGSSVMLRASPRKTGGKLTDFIGMLKCSPDERLSTAELCRPVDLQDEDHRGYPR